MRYCIAEAACCDYINANRSGSVYLKLILIVR